MLVYFAHYAGLACIITAQKVMVVLSTCCIYTNIGWQIYGSQNISLLFAFGIVFPLKFNSVFESNLREILIY